MVRLKDIAQRANVSVMTVSKVLRDAKDISAQTKLRVRKLAEEMGYVPDALAQSMRSGTTKLMGLIIPSVANPVFARVILAIEEKAHEAGYDLLIAHSLNKPEREESAIRRMLARRVDGLFIVPTYRLHRPPRDGMNFADAPCRPSSSDSPPTSAGDLRTSRPTTSSPARSPHGTCWNWATNESPS